MAHSEMPHGVWCVNASRCCSLTALTVACCSALPSGSSSTSVGIRYSNIEPDHERSAARLPWPKKGRPSAPQCSTGTSPLAMATRLAKRASLASKS